MAIADRVSLFHQFDRLYRGGTTAGQDDPQLLGRFVNDHDEGAFEALVQRHGPLVLGLCRRTLRDPRDIEDAFQATFLILARRAGTIRKGSSLSSWLYGVAHKVATRCRSDVMRRRLRETSMDVLDVPIDGAASLADELGPVLDQELSRLPEKYRAPIVLCYLRDQTHDQAAAELKWPVGTVRSRLARGRELLRGRLTRRGWSPSDVMLGVAPMITPRSFNAPVPHVLVEATVAAARRFLGGVATGLAPAAATLTSNLTGHAPTLARGVLSTMAMTQYTWIGSGLAAVALVAGGTGAGARVLSARGDGGPDDKPAATATAGEAPKPAAVSTATAASSGEKDVSARLDQLERTLKLLLGKLEQLPPLDAAGRIASTVPSTTSIQPSDAAIAPDLSVTTPGTRSTSAAYITAAPAVASQPRLVSEPALAPVARSEPSLATVSDAPAPSGVPSPSLVPDGASLPPPRSEPGPQPAIAAGFGPEAVEARVEPDLSPRREDEPRPARRSRRAPTPQPAADMPDDQPRAHLSRAMPASRPDSPPSDDDPVSRPSPDRQMNRGQSPAADPFSAPQVSLREIEARIQIAKRKLERTRSLLKAAAISNSEAQEPVDELLLLMARLRGMAEDAGELANEGRANLARLRAELDRAKAQLALSRGVVVRNSRLSSRGVVSSEEVARAESESLVAGADVSIKEAELEGAHVKLKSLEGRQQRLQGLLEKLVEGVPELKESNW